VVFEYKNKKGQMYYLHTKDVKLKSTGRIQKIFFFSKDHHGGINMLPGYRVVENPRTGLPFLKKK
jgi:hypothetical protein